MANAPVRLDPFQNIVGVSWAGAYTGFLQVLSEVAGGSAIVTLAFKWITPNGDDFVGQRDASGVYSDPPGAPNLAQGEPEVFPSGFFNGSAYQLVLNIGKAIERARDENPDVEELILEFRVTGYNSWDRSGPAQPDGTHFNQPADVKYTLAFTSRRGRNFEGSGLSVTGGVEVQPPIVAGDDTPTDGPGNDYEEFFVVGAASATYLGGLITAATMRVRESFWLDNLYINIATGEARWGETTLEG